MTVEPESDDGRVSAPPARDISPADFALWGLPGLAFVRRIAVPMEDGRLADGDGWSIHAADGTRMGVAPSREMAFAAIRQHELEPMSVH